MSTHVLQEDRHLSARRWSSAVGIDATVALLTLLIVTGAALLGALPLDLPRPVPATAPPTVFSSARALDHIRAIAQTPHPMGSPANAGVRDYLIRELAALGLQPSVQKITAVNCCWYGGFGVGTPENVIARLEGTTGSSQALLLAAHYDSMPTTPGASDDGAGVAAILETVRALRAEAPLNNDVILLFTDGHERGLLGARAFVDSHPWARDVRLVLNLEGRGHTGAALMFETSDESGWIVQEFAKATPYPFTTSDSVAFYKLTGGGTDLTVFMDAGWSGLNVGYTGGLTHYHTRLDTVQELDERSLQHLGSYALALTRHFGTVSLDHTKAPNDIYFNLFRFLVHYPENWAFPLMAVVGLLFAGVLAFGFKTRQLTLGGIVLGFLALPGSIIAAALGSFLLWALISMRYPGEHVVAVEYVAPLFWIGFASLTVASTAALYSGFGTRIRSTNLAMGALLWWQLLTVATSMLFRPASYNFTWPLLFALLGLAALFALGDNPPVRWYRCAVLMLSAIPAVFLFAPAIYGITLINGLFLPNVVPVFALAIVLLLGLLIPHLDLIARPGRWILPGAAAALGLGLVLAGILTAGFDARHPKPNSMLYALNADTQQAIWASFDELPDAWTAHFLGANGRKGSVAGYLGESQPLLRRAAPALALAAPHITMLDDRTGDGFRTIRMRVTTPPQASFVRLSTPGQVTSTTVDGRSAPDAPDRGAPSAWAMNYWNPPVQGFELILGMPGSEPFTLIAVAARPGLPVIPGRSYPARSPDMMAQHELEDLTLVSKSFTFVSQP